MVQPPVAASGDTAPEGPHGFVDDRDASGPTLVGSASLASVADWFNLETEETRRRLRTNLEIAGLEPFEEDSLFGPRASRAGSESAPSN